MLQQLYGPSTAARNIAGKLSSVKALLIVRKQENSSKKNTVHLDGIVELPSSMELKLK